MREFAGWKSFSEFWALPSEAAAREQNKKNPKTQFLVLGKG
jgi:hypothetical protein